MTELKDEVALVTGASRGIGAACAVALARAGAHVIGTATSAAGLAAIESLLAEHNLAGKAMLLDIASAVSIDALLGALDEGGQWPTILVNNAGITRDNLALRMRDEEWDAVIATNLTGVFRLTRGCLRAMTKARKGRIINISSVVGATGNGGQANYAATKAGVVAFGKSIARELGSRNITVNAVAPGFIDTDMTRALSENQRKGLLEQIPLGRFGTAADIAHAVTFLASPAAAYITGATLHVNGGMFMG